jgi:hypothetical protein
MNSLLKINRIKLRSMGLFQGFNRFQFRSFGDSFKDKEKSAEKIYIDKHERELMKKLLEKLKVGEDTTSRNPNDLDVNREDKDNLDKLFIKHKKEVPQELILDLIKWKQGDY